MNEELMLKILDNQATILSMLTKLDNKIDTVKDELRNEFKSDIATLRDEMHAMKDELQAQIASQQTDIVLVKLAIEGLKVELQKTTETLRSEIRELAAITDEKLDYAFHKIKSLS